VVLVGEAGGRLRYDFRALPFEVTLATSVWGSRDDLRVVLELARRGELRWEVETLPLVQGKRGARAGPPRDGHRSPRPCSVAKSCPV
jgi:hypothetical protein